MFCFSVIFFPTTLPGVYPLKIHSGLFDAVCFLFAILPSSSRYTHTHHSFTVCLFPAHVRHRRGFKVCTVLVPSEKPRLPLPSPGPARPLSPQLSRHLQLVMGHIRGWFTPSVGPLHRCVGTSAFIVPRCWGWTGAGGTEQT